MVYCKLSFYNYLLLFIYSFFKKFNRLKKKHLVSPTKFRRDHVQCLHRWADEGRKLRKSGGEFSEDEKR
ncbi:hypothetical protein LINPERPRIM_LOCUS22452 [Linum perenne]